MDELVGPIARGLGSSAPVLGAVALPIGISFFTFQRLSYVLTPWRLLRMQALAAARAHVQRWPGVSVARPNERCRWDLDEPIRFSATSTDGLLAGDLAFHFDSFGLTVLEAFGPWFDSVTGLHSTNDDRPPVADVMGSADIIVVQVVQRRLPEFLASGLAERLARAIADGIAA